MINYNKLYDENNYMNYIRHYYMTIFIEDISFLEKKQKSIKTKKYSKTKFTKMEKYFLLTTPPAEFSYLFNINNNNGVRSQFLPVVYIRN